MDNDTNVETSIDIRDSMLMGSYRGITEDRTSSMSAILLSFSKNTSYNTVNKLIDEVLNLNGKNRGVIQEWEEANNESDDVSGLVESTEDIITSLLLEEINQFIKGLEKNKANLNQLKSIVVKFIQTNFYYFHQDLYKPIDYVDVINRYINYPSQFTDFYLEVIDRLAAVNPDSSLIPIFNSQNNSVLLRSVSNIFTDDATPEEMKIFLNSRKEYREIINPLLPEICDAIGINFKTYQDNIGKVTNKLVTNLADKELTRRFNQIILLNGI